MTPARLQTVFRQAADSGDVPGVAAAAATADGVIFEGAFGKRSLATGAPMTSDTVVWIASMTKAVTGACAMQTGGAREALARRRHRDDPAGAWTRAGAGRLSMLPASRDCVRRSAPITLRHLLTHTAGFAYDIWNGDIARYMEVTGTPGIISCKNAALELPLIADPARNGNTAFRSIGPVRRSRRSPARPSTSTCSENLLQPLGMTDTGLQDRRCATAAPGHDSCAHAGGTGADRNRNAAEPGIFCGRRRSVFDGGRLPEVHPDDPAWRHFQRRQVLQPETVATMSRNAMGESGVQRDEDGRPGVDATMSISSRA